MRGSVNEKRNLEASQRFVVVVDNGHFAARFRWRTFEAESEETRSGQQCGQTKVF